MTVFDGGKKSIEIISAPQETFYNNNNKMHFMTLFKSIDIPHLNLMCFSAVNFLTWCSSAELTVAFDQTV